MHMVLINYLANIQYCHEPHSLISSYHTNRNFVMYNFNDFMLLLFIYKVIWLAGSDHIKLITNYTFAAFDKFLS